MAKTNPRRRSDRNTPLDRHSQAEKSAIPRRPAQARAGGDYRAAHLVRHVRRGAIAVALALLIGGCAESNIRPAAQLPQAPVFPPDHAYTLDELVQRSTYLNASLDVARYEALAAEGLVDRVKALWLPVLRYDLAATAYDNDMSYHASAYDVVHIDVPITGAYNITNTAAVAQILATFGKRTSGLKQAKMYAAIKRLDVLRQQDAVALDVATYYDLIALTSDIDAVLDDTQRRLKVLGQVAREQNARGSLHVNRLDTLETDLFLAELDQARVAIQAGRQQAYSALRQAVGVDHDEPLLLATTSLPRAVLPDQIIGVYETIATGFAHRPELRMVDLFAHLRAEQVNFAKKAWAPNIAFLGSFINVAGNHNTILGALDGLVAGFIVDWPIYDPARRARLREALGMEYAAAAFQRQVEQLVTLEIETTAVECQRALVTTFKAARALDIADEHFDVARRAFSHDLVSAQDVAIALGADTLVKVQHLTALFAYQQDRAKLRRVTAAREEALGY